MQYRMYVNRRNAQGCLSHGMSHNELALSVNTRLQCPLGQQHFFGRPFSSSERRPRLN